MNKISYIINSRNDVAQSISAYVNGQPFTLSAGHSNFKLVLAELSKESPDPDKLVKLLDVKNAVREYTGNTVKIQNGEVYYNGERLHGVLVERIISFMRGGMPYKPLLKFLENLMQNPSFNAREELYTFLEALNENDGGQNAITLTSDGCFLAYKGVGADYFSITSGNIRVLKGEVVNGRINNSVGQKVEVERAQVDDNKERGCSFGLHAGTFKYANEFAGVSGHLMVVKVNPKDVVSIPRDCSFQKLRTCAYEVVDELVVRQKLEAQLETRYDDDDLDSWDDLDDGESCPEFDGEVVEDDCGNLHDAATGRFVGRA